MVVRLSPGLLFALVAVSVLQAQTPLGTAFTYQGRLSDAGSPANGPYDMHFRLYDAATGGTQLGPIICYNNISVADGLLTATLDFGDQFGGQERFLDIAIRTDTGLNCADTSGFTTLSPRQRLTAAPYAMDASKLDGLDSTAFLQAIPVPLTLSGSSGTYMIRAENTSTVGGASSITGLSSGTSGAVYGGRFETTSNSGRGVYGWATATSGTTYGIYGRSDAPSGRGVYGQATATSGDARGVLGISSSTSGYGAFGYATATTGTTYGLFGQSDSTSGHGVYGLASTSSGFNYGVYGRSDSDNGTGVRGESPYWGVYGYSFGLPGGLGIGVIGHSNATDGIGVSGWASSYLDGVTFGGHFLCGSTNGVAVYGSSSASSGSTYGGQFRVYSDAGRAVYGRAYAATGTTYGGRFENDSASGRAVYASANATGASDTPYGMRGYCSTATSGYAVYAAGDLGASGTKPFRIDHPSDPENKYLLHYAAESPEVINFYSGKVTLDGNGEAIVELPAYFASINRDPRYTLTAVGAPMPMLHVAQEISDETLAAGEQAGPGIAPPACSFRIAGGVPRGKVSWRVEAVRNDLRMRLHGAPVEREKTGPERGNYQHPEYYGLPPERGIDYRAGDEPAHARKHNP